MLFNSIIYGPIHSRRLGISLGINLMPVDSKVCTFDCVYCECGFNAPHPSTKLPTLEAYQAQLEQALTTIDQTPDVLTFSGNGEPTLHPKFKQIVDITCNLRDRYCPKAKITVLSNSTQLYKPEVREALQRVDYRILKLDSAIDQTMRLIDQPIDSALTVDRIVEYLEQWQGNFVLQTCFLRGEYKGNIIDNTTTEELEAWYKVVRHLHPKQVMIYVIDRATPVKTLQKLSRREMEQIAAPLVADGIEVQISA